MRFSPATAIITAIPVAIAFFIIGYALHGGPQRDGNPVGPLQFVQVTPAPAPVTATFGKNDAAIFESCAGNSSCIWNIAVATTMKATPAPTQVSCESSSTTGCLTFTGVMNSTDTGVIPQVIDPLVNFTATIAVVTPALKKAAKHP